MKCEKCKTDLTAEELAAEMQALKDRIALLENQLMLERLTRPTAIPIPMPYPVYPMQPVQPWRDWTQGPNWPNGTIISQQPLNGVGHYSINCNDGAAGHRMISMNAGVNHNG